MAKKAFYLVKRKDKLTGGKPTFYCRFRDEAGDPLPWKSTGHTSRTRAELWAQAEIDKARTALPGADTTFSDFAADFFTWGRCPWLARQSAKGRAISQSWARAKRQMHVNHVLPAFDRFPLAKLTRPAIETWLVAVPRSNQTRNHILYTLKTIFAEAEASGLILRNLLEHAEPMGKRPRRRDAFTLDDLRLLFPAKLSELISVWGELKYAALFFTMASTGMREGEARALL